jgi:DNA-binding SARP family transcriptional activator/TolB-like protein/Tfp pilus assembly protein PilF
MVEGDPPSELRISSRKGQALLAYLAMHPDHSASREHLAALFWGDRRDEQARHNLRQCLVTLRRDLLKGAADILSIEASSVGLRTEHLSIDADEFATISDSSQTSDLERAVALYRGEFLSEFTAEEPFDSWVQRTRSQLDDIAARVFEKCAQQADARGDGKQAVAAAERLIAFDTFREDRQRIALRIFSRYRGREFALTHAEACLALLKGELDVDPEPATQALIDDIRRGTISAIPTPIPDRVDATVDAGSDLDEPPVARAMDSDVSVVAERPRSGLPTSILAAARDYATSRPLTALAASGLCLAALLFALPWMSARLEGSNALSATTADKTISRRTAMVETRGVVPILLLPFAITDGADAATRNVANSLTETLNDALSRFGGLGVISHQTALAYEGRRVDVSTIGSELGVRYVIEGRIKSEGWRSSVNVQLVDTANRLEVWSDRFERDDVDRAGAQDEIAARIARGVQIAVTLAEASRPIEVPAREPTVGSLLVRGLAIHFGGLSRKNVADELALFEEALRLEPELPQAMLGVSMALTQAVLNSLADDPRASLDRAEGQLDRVLEKEPTSYRAYYWKALVAKARGRYDEALNLISKSIEFNPSLALSSAQLGDILTKLGRPAEGLDHILYAIRVSPKDTSIGFFYIFAGTAELELYHEQAASDWFRRAIAVQPGSPTPYKYLAAAYALMGNKTEAADCWSQFRRLSVPPAMKQLADKLQPETASGAKSPESRLRDGLRIALTL